MSIHWVHLVPYADHVRSRTVSYLKSLNLLPQGCGIFSPLLVLPLDIQLGLEFDALGWTLFPTEEVLLEHIRREETWLQIRTAFFDHHDDKADVGRPPHDDTQLELPPFYVFFSPNSRRSILMHHDPTPTSESSGHSHYLLDTTNASGTPALRVNLPLSVPAVVHTCLARMSRLAQTPQTDRLIRLGLYLTSLQVGSPSAATPTGQLIRGKFMRPPGPNFRYVDGGQDIIEEIPDTIAVFGNDKEAVKAHIDVLIGDLPQSALFCELEESATSDSLYGDSF
ncbi:hypothetical protein EXIGLDRAFT_777961 [Exidia glandulosa HHB12029]|uniref:Uncharacterized protein n=1 Tax=Exidia glandulosa HHB12029 TaxID=1314781 RepID=A0A165CSG0_EXIGL|nr:hypothetical protein EXIGLDRAFT_777961 [Exidia glandulosa HHB12029]